MNPSLKTRLISLDVFRGLAIAGMILVNTPGSWSHVYPPLLHAEWHGFTPTDLVFPAFLFIAGAAMAFSLRKYLKPPAELVDETSPHWASSSRSRQDEAQPQSSAPDGRAIGGEGHHVAGERERLYWRLGRRCLLLFTLGLFLNGFGLILKTWPAIAWSNWRWLGVLQRISLAYLGAALLVLKVPKRWLGAIAAFILFGYWLLLTVIPIPGFGVGDLSLENNVAGYIDRALLGASHLYTPTFDPEGLVSTIPAIVTVLLGYFTGEFLRDRVPARQHSITLSMWGLAGIISGSLWGLILPINKQLWTSSYVLYSAGWSLLILALCYELIEVRGIKKWSWPWRVMGLNAITIFVASGIIVRILYNTKIGTGEAATSTYNWLYETLFTAWAGALNGSLLFAIANVILWCLVATILYRQQWFIKL